MSSPKIAFKKMFHETKVAIRDINKTQTFRWKPFEKINSDKRLADTLREFLKENLWT